MGGDGGAWGDEMVGHEGRAGLGVSKNSRKPILRVEIRLSNFPVLSLIQPKYVQKLDHRAVGPPPA